MKIGLIGINSYKNESQFLLIKQALGKNLSGFFAPHSEEILPISKTYNIRLYSSATEMFSATDAIYFANSLKPNYDFALNAIKKACHLFIEDFSALNIDEIKYLYKVAFEARTYIHLKRTKSYSPEYMAISDYLSSAKLIEIKTSYIHLLRNTEYFNEIFNNLYLADNYLNAGIKKTSTFALPVDKNHFSLVNIRVDYDNGNIVNLKSENIVTKAKSKASFYGSEQVIHIDFLEHTATELKIGNGYVTRNELKIPDQNDLNNEINDFIDSCKNLYPQNISESPKIFKIIKTTQEILESLFQTFNE